ncbi:MAG: hypothetical protein CO171_02020 [Syntrophobacterales bacterium CG_4_9_14_3_um_filter_49_8]|nr:MAG: hypothetical protein CO171_02020 [Syntrophobacterales bacterium CG_4_9_14_3_um_filter_49_8]
MSYSVNEENLLLAAEKWCSERLSKASISEVEDAITQMTRKLSEHMVNAYAENLDPRATYEGMRIECKCGGEAVFKGYRRRWIRTICGDIKPKRAYYYCPHCHTGISPWDGEQGLDGRVWSPGVKSIVSECCARLTYSEVSTLLSRVLGLDVEESSQQDIVADVGQRLREADACNIENCFDEDVEIVVERSPNRLYICVDAAKAHTDGAWHDIKTGVIFEGERPSATSKLLRDNMVNAVYVAAQEGCDAFGRRVYAQAVLSGLRRAGEVVILGDGAEWIWNLVSTHFPGCVQILDYYHACEHIWELAGVIYGKDTPACKRWAKDHCNRLEEYGPRSLLRSLRRRKGKTEEQREAIRLQLGYFEDHKERMNYPAYKAKAMMIGSGPVESACKIVVNQRLKQAGMRWTKEGADSILALRTAVLSEQTERIQHIAKAA